MIYTVCVCLIPVSESQGNEDRGYVNQYVLITSHFLIQYDWLTIRLIAGQ